MKVFQCRRRAPTFSRFTVLAVWTLVRTGFFVVFRLLYRLRYDGQENIPLEGPVIYVANHQSNLDPPSIGCLVWDRPFTSLARSSLFDNKLLGWLIRLPGAIPIRRGRSDAAAIRTAIAELQAGGCLLMFPEGSRSTDGAVKQFKAGILVLVRRTKVPVVPIAIEGAFDTWPIGKRLPRFRGRIKVRASRAIPADELLADPPEVTLQRLRCQIDAMRLELRQELRQVTKDRYPAAGPADIACQDAGS